MSTINPANLFVLPFDHRASFTRDILGIHGELAFDDFKKVVELKQIVFDGFYQALIEVEQQGFYTKTNFGVLVDELYGADVFKQAKKLGVITAIPVEKSGQDIFDFEYGAEFGNHLLLNKPSYAKVLVRYNPENYELNKVQLERLVQLDHFCSDSNISLLFELLVPPTKKDLELCKTKEVYDTKRRPQLTIQALKEIQEYVKSVALWKLEGFDLPTWRDIETTVSANSSIIFLGRGSDEDTVNSWLKSAAKVQKVIGFAVGRTIFLDALSSFVSGSYHKEQAVAEIKNKFLSFINLWHENR